METSKVLGSRAGLSVDGSMLSSSNFRESDRLGNDTPSYEKSLLDEMDSYWEDLNARLTVSRMVSDSVIKGMVNATEEEAAEKITTKEAEVAFLNKKLQYYESNAAKGNNSDLTVKVERQKTKPELLWYSLGARQELDFVKHLDRLRIAAEEQLQRLPQGPLKDSVSEQQWEEEIQREIGSVMVHNFIRSLQGEFETKVCEQRSHVNTINKNWQKRVDELSTMRQELVALYRSLFSSEPGLLFSHNSLEILEECSSGKRKDHFPWKAVGNLSPSTFNIEDNGKNYIVMEKSEESGKPTSTDSPQLKCKTKEELITYYKTEMTKMKRQHDLALQEKTEELFSLKRELLKEKSSSPLHFRKEKDLELMKKKISGFISKLDDILSENGKLPIIHDDQDILCSLKERIDALFMENQGIQSLLADQEGKRLASQVPLEETNFQNQIKRLQLDMEDVKIETTTRDDIYKCALKELIGELQNEMEGLEMVGKIVEDNNSFIYREVVGGALSSVNDIIAKSSEEKDSIKEVLFDKEKALCLEVEENERLKQEITSLLIVIEEREKLVSEAVSELVQQKVHFDLVCHELSISRGEVSKQEVIISNSKKESDLMKGKLDEAFRQIHQYEVEISNLNQKFKIVSNALEEAERQKNILHSNIQEKRRKLASAITKEEEQKKRLESIIISMVELSKAIGNSECRLTEYMETNESRLKKLSHQFSQLVQQADLLKKKGLWYKQRLERKCSDLQKAETEVDLLGDDVDVLLGLLEKIYMALNHYSPVLQHYPGVVEILELIKREMKGENTKLA